MARVLSTRYIVVDVTTPAGTAAAAPLSTQVNLGHVELVAFDLRIPAGHAGLTGWRLVYSGTTILPFSNPAAWIVGDDEKLPFDVGFEVDRTLSVVSYNLDVNDHVHYGIAKVADLPTAPDGPVTLLDIRSVG